MQDVAQFMGINLMFVVDFFLFVAIESFLVFYVFNVV